jgi:hypothetical protein
MASIDKPSVVATALYGEQVWRDLGRIPPHPRLVGQ